MTTNFLKAFPVLINIERGYVNDPDDRGGETKYGVSKRSYPNLDIKNLTLKQAQEIYYRDFWNHKRLNLDNFEYKIAEELFDTAVNSGQGKAGEIMQEALNLMNRNGSDYPDLIEDGYLGPATISAYHKVNKEKLLKALNGLQFMNYVRICRANPVQERFFNGWLNRV